MIMTAHTHSIYGLFSPLAYGLVRSENDSIPCIFATPFTRSVSNIPDVTASYRQRRWPIFIRCHFLEQFLT